MGGSSRDENYLLWPEVHVADFLHLLYYEEKRVQSADARGLL